MYRFSDGVAVSKVDDELVVLDSVRGVYYGLNATGARMVGLLMETGDVETTVSRFAEEYNAPQDQIRTDLLALVQELENRGLVEH